ncbi:uncharacterized protein LOC141900465 [Tubulanus polymorphus]|uniref:uncharacterized protein LOC141900465 n=1 Tax=Tubulanus polymorphus TaxID=672921 RepID=UPI003DA5401F
MRTQIVVALFVCFAFAVINTVTAGESTKWCCNVTPEVKEEKRVMYYAQKVIDRKSVISTAEYLKCMEKHRNSKAYKPCGTPVPKYVASIRYVKKQKVDKVQVKARCPEENLVCCEGYQPHNGDCLDAEELALMLALGM